MLKNRNCCKTIMLLYTILYEQFTTCTRQYINFIKTVLFECINESIKVYHYALSYDDSSIRVYRSFITIFHECLILLFLFIVHFPIMVALWLMFSVTYHAQNYAGIICGSLACIHNNYTQIQFACHKPTTLAISLITVTSTLETFAIEPQ